VVLILSPLPAKDVPERGEADLWCLLAYLLGGLAGIVVGFVWAHLKNGDPPWRRPDWLRWGRG
jgi:hypothetical protein